MIICDKCKKEIKLFNSRKEDIIILNIHEENQFKIKDDIDLCSDCFIDLESECLNIIKDSYSKFLEEE